MNYKLIKLDDKVIITSDEEIKKSDYVFEDCEVGESNIKEIHVCQSVDNFNGWISFKNENVKTGLGWCKKIIAGLPELPSIDYNGFEEELDIIDVGKLALAKYPINIITECDRFDDGVIERSWETDVNEELRDGFKQGFIAAQSNKRFDFDDMVSFAVFYMAHQGKATKYYGKDLFQEWLKLQPKTFDVELEMYRPNMAYQVSEHWSPKITNNKVKITKVL